MGQPPVPHLPSRRDARDAGHARLSALHRPDVCGSPSGNGGDPIVLYDQFAHRWIASQLAYPNYPAGPYYQCVAYSSTDDPTGTWCAYQFVALQSKLNDYPKFGVWPAQHAYMITVNQFSEPGDGWAGVGVFALERDAMMSGCGSARMLYKDMFTVEPNLWGGMLPADLDGDTLPPANAPAPLIEVDAQEWDPAHFPQDRLDVWNATVDWSGGGSINVSHEGPLPTAPFDGNLCNFAACIPQPGTSPKLDTLNDRLMYRMAYRNFGDHQALVVNHSVDADGADHRGRSLVRAAQDDRELVHLPAGHLRAGHDREPLDGLGRDGPRRQHGRRLLDEQRRPRRTTRASATPVGSRPIRSGSCPRASRRSSPARARRRASSRWGDYSMLAIDPTDDCTFWFTSEYMATTGRRVEDADRELQVPVLRWAATTSATATASTSAATAASASASSASATTTTTAASAATAAASAAATTATSTAATATASAVRCRVPSVLGLRLGAAKTKIRRANCSVGNGPPRPLQAFAARPCRQRSPRGPARSSAGTSRSSSRSAAASRPGTSRESL